MEPSGHTHTQPCWRSLSPTPMTSQRAATISQTQFSDSLFYADTSICYPSRSCVNGPHQRQNSFCAYYISQKLHPKARLYRRQVGQWMPKDSAQLVNKINMRENGPKGWGTGGLGSTHLAQESDSICHYWTEQSINVVCCKKNKTLMLLQIITIMMANFEKMKVLAH